MISERKALAMQSNNNPLVAIYMITYNHADFIAEAIESVMMQQTNFTYKLFIGEDASKDNTRSICLEWKQKYPAKIELLLNETNIGANQNALQTFNACHQSGAKYIAILEGDDYWIDPQKLQKQVDILENNSDCCIAYTAITKSNGSSTLNSTSNHLKTDFSNLIQGNYITTLSVLLRTKKMFPLPEWFTQLVIGDWPLYLWLMRDGEKAIYLNDITAVYRPNLGMSVGIKNDSENELKIIDNILITLVKDIRFQNYKSTIQLALNKNKTKYITVYNRQKKYRKAFITLLRIMMSSPNFATLKLYFYSLKTNWS